jgi:hypothetical protein
MIRSPPPTSWPRSPRFSIFNFPEENNATISSQSSGVSLISSSIKSGHQSGEKKSVEAYYYVRVNIYVLQNLKT